MHFKSVTIPPSGLVRALHLAALADDGATVYQRGADAADTIEARDTWPPETTGLTPCPSPIPANWTQLTPAP